MVQAPPSPGGLETPSTAHALAAESPARTPAVAAAVAGKSASTQPARSNGLSRGGALAAAAVAAVAVIVAAAATYSSVEILYPTPFMLIEQGCFLGGGAVIGSLPTVLLLYAAHGERGAAKAGPLKRRVLSGIALAWGLASLALPFVLPSSRGGLGPMSLALCLWINFWKTMDICAGTCPPSVLTSVFNLAFHMMFLIEYKTTRRLLPRSESELQVFPRSASEHVKLDELDLSGVLGESKSSADGPRQFCDAPEAAQPGELRAQLVSLAQVLSIFFCLASASELTPPPALLAHPAGPHLVHALVVYSHVWYIYCFLMMACDVNSSVLLFFGYRPQAAFRSPLTASTSPTDFWSRRWNMLVKGLFHRTVFTPLRNRGAPSWASALSAFFVSGAFHEYAFAPASQGAALGSLTSFFCLQAGFCTAELMLRKASKSLRLLRALDDATPDWLRVIFSTLLLVPFSPLFMAPLLAHGTIDQMRTIMLRVRLH